MTVANRNISLIINLSQKNTILFFEVTTNKDEKSEEVINEIIKDLSKIDYVDKEETKYLGIEKNQN